MMLSMLPAKAEIVLPARNEPLLMVMVPIPPDELMMSPSKSPSITTELMRPNAMIEPAPSRSAPGVLSTMPIRTLPVILCPTRRSAYSCPPETSTVSMSPRTRMMPFVSRLPMWRPATSSSTVPEMSVVMSRSRNASRRVMLPRLVVVVMSAMRSPSVETIRLIGPDAEIAPRSRPRTVMVSIRPSGPVTAMLVSRMLSAVMLTIGPEMLISDVRMFRPTIMLRSSPLVIVLPRTSLVARRLKMVLSTSSAMRLKFLAVIPPTIEPSTSTRRSLMSPASRFVLSVFRSPPTMISLGRNSRSLPMMVEFRNSSALISPRTPRAWTDVASYTPSIKTI